MPDNTIGQVLDRILDDIAQAMNGSVDRMADLERRVRELEARPSSPIQLPPPAPQPSPQPPPPQEPVVPAPTPILNPVRQPVTNYSTEEATNVRSGAYVKVRETARAGNIPITHMNDVIIDIDGHVESIWIADSRRVHIRGRGTVGTITVSEYASGRAGHRNEDIAVESVRCVTDRTAMDIQHATNVYVTKVEALAIRNYAIWMSDCSNATVTYNNFATQGDESCVRLVNVRSARIVANDLLSRAKHCFRVHGISSEINFMSNTVVGPRGMMLGTMPSDALTNINVTDNRIVNASVQSLGVPVNTPAALRGFVFRGNTLDNSVDELSSYQGVPTWIIER